MTRRHLADAAWLAGIVAAFVILTPVYLALTIVDRLRAALEGAPDE